jgi:hypothetical protein
MLKAGACCAGDVEPHENEAAKDGGVDDPPNNDGAFDAPSATVVAGCDCSIARDKDRTRDERPPQESRSEWSGRYRAGGPVIVSGGRGTCAAPKPKPMPMLLNAVVAAGELNVAVDAGRPNIPPPVLAEPELLAATAASSVPAFAAAGAPNGEAAEPNAGAASAATIQPPLAVGAAPRRPPAAGVAAPRAGASAL